MPYVYPDVPLPLSTNSSDVAEETLSMLGLASVIKSFKALKMLSGGLSTLGLNY